MPEYIEREKAIEYIESHFPYRCSEDFVMGQQDCIEQLKSLPTADVVKVVRCKDCAHYGGITFGNICRRWSGLNVKNCTKPDDYCSYGIRKDGEEE